MFTGLVEGMGTVAHLVSRPAGKRLVVSVGSFADGVGVGASVAVNGCCLTVVEVEGDRLSFDTVPETLSRTNLGKLVEGSPVNIERSLKLGDELGGHLVSGHIDGVGRLVERQDDEDCSFFWFRTPEPLMRQLASKGSIAVDGVSLTLVDVTNDKFSVALIPHTLKITTLGALKRDDAVNLETDILAKYVERQLEWAV
ncbi:MAG: riboflavin synthase, partial [Pirellulales bacterium]